MYFYDENTCLDTLNGYMCGGKYVGSTLCTNIFDIPSCLHEFLIPPRTLFIRHQALLRAMRGFWMHAQGTMGTGMISG